MNLYYSTAGLAEIWLWDRDINGGVLNPPEYMFSFETNEGFDTDNDNLNDIEELSSHGDSIYADPLDVDTPRARKALYLNGNAAARTRNPFFHDRWAMTSYTVEFWFRAQLPDAGLHRAAAGAAFDSQRLGCEIIALRQKGEQAHEVAVKHDVLPVPFSLRRPGGRRWSAPRGWRPANLSAPGCTENRSPSGG